jgi:hypothetical protein
MSDFSQVLMAINNLDNKCVEYGEEENGKKKSTLRFNINMEGYAHRPKTFNITDDRVKFAIRQLQGIKIFLSDLVEINKDMRNPKEYPQLVQAFQQLEQQAKHN